MTFQELKQMFLEREYSPGIIDSAIAKARAIPRQQALRRVLLTGQQMTNRLVLVVSFNPRLPSIPNITRKHCRSMVGQEHYLKSVFPEPPMVAYKRQRNIREAIVRAKVAPERQKRTPKGVKNCENCLACSYIKEGKYILGKNHEGRKFRWCIRRSISCNSTNIVYLLEFDKDYCKPSRNTLDKHLKNYVREYIKMLDMSDTNS